MKFIILILGFSTLISSCENEISRDENRLTLNDIIEQMDTEQENAQSNIKECPNGHKDSIIPIIYGYPSERLFEKEDSGLVFIGGCEVLDDKTWWCRIHEISF